jgi:RNA polymerase sigma-70 factor (ECF subfamily)
VSGWVEQRPAIIVKTPAQNGPAYFILLNWNGDSVTAIRDFAHARYVLEGAQIIETM